MTDRIEQLEAALDSLSEGFVIFDLDQRVSFWNQAASSITGFASVSDCGASVAGIIAGAAGSGDIRVDGDKGGE